jgi:3-deoxy-manno-octulosonate cytidylyltransferase (CMP-KDO synthetase)
MSFHVIIPARYEARRLPGKPLRDIAGKPMIQRVYERGLESGAGSVTIATDDLHVEKAVKEFGGNVVLTSDHHESGTDRVAEAVQILDLGDHEIIVNLQGDEPLMSPELVGHVAKQLAEDKQADVATACIAISDMAQLADPNVVKVVFGQHGHALYFSRAPIPWLRDDDAETGQKAWRHIGLYAFRCDYLQAFSQMSSCWLEQHESLEQLRVLWHGGTISVYETDEDPGHGIDTQEDLLKVRRLFGDDTI